jgi:hypothetical protein
MIVTASACYGQAVEPGPLHAAVVAQIRDSLRALDAAIDGLTVEELNRAPAPETNSLAVLVAHTVDTIRSILHDLADDPIQRNRAAAFALTDASTDHLRTMIDACDAELDWLVGEAFARPLERIVKRYRDASQAWWLLQVVAHSREHAGHAELTRQLVAGRPATE